MDESREESTGQPRGLRRALVAVIAIGLLVVGGGAGWLIAQRDGPSAADVGFSQDMATHHLQAVEMANLAVDRSEDPAVRQLAFDIAETQQNQVGRMQGWLSMWGESVTNPSPMAWMGHDMGDMVMLMPGMATEEELSQLAQAQGSAFDVMFLELMIRHHEGGSGMASYAAAHAEVPAVQQLAQSIYETQSAETQTMKDMLAARS